MEKNNPFVKAIKYIYLIIGILIYSIDSKYGVQFFIYSIRAGIIIFIIFLIFKGIKSFKDGYNKKE
jgi:hypothetical protein